MGVQLSNPTVSVNNDAVSIMPNSLTFTEGLGEQLTRAASGGGGNVEQIYSANVETNFSKISFDIPATTGNIALAKQWKVNTNQNLVQVTGRTPEGTVTRTFTQAALLNDYEVALGADTVISLEFTANPAI
jgi:hypothetical protein